ncbi:MAG TPA: hypothetical protein VEK39_00345 [Solirubrobacterales bacterium]|nr:hypothetical protein [Solirubrobacterales bacterium]
MEAKRSALPLLRAPRSHVLTGARAAITSTWALGALVFVATWGGGGAAPTPYSVDISMHAGLNLAAAQGLNFGPDLDFTYGPLAFLKTYLVFYVWPARLAALYGIALHLALCVSLVWAARRSFPLLVAIPLALGAALLLRGDVSAAAIRDDGAVVVLAFIWCIAALGDRPPSWSRRLVVLGGGPFAAIELLAKLNTGVIVLTLLTVTVIALEGDRRRNVVTFAAAFAASIAALWFAVGQGLGDVPDFVGATAQIVSGYSSGAYLEWTTRDYDYLLAPLVIAAAVAIAWVSARGDPTRRRTVILALVAYVAFADLKGGFVSHDVFHMAVFYSTMLGICLAFPVPERPRIRFGAAILIAAVGAAGLSATWDGYPMTDPIESVSNGASTVATLADTGRLERDITSSRASLMAAYDLDDRMLAMLEDHSVHVDPSEAAAVWAYQLDWRPLPVFQSYVAWTEDLDERNAEVVAAADGPERILRRPGNPLGRFPAFESPAAMLAMLCHFAPLRTTDDWEVLGRVGDRCGEPEAIGGAEARYGEPIPVPSAGRDEVVFARVRGLEASGLERLVTLLYRARPRQVSFDGGPSYTLTSGTAADGLLLRAPARVDYPGPFALAPNANNVTFLLSGSSSDDRITIDFFSMPVRPLRR